MNAVLLQLLLILAQQVGGGLFMIWFFRWRKREEKATEIPSDLMERFKELETIVDSFRERMVRVETKLNGAAWKSGGLSGEHR